MTSLIIANLLANGGFEEEWAGNHSCYILPEHNEPYFSDIGNIFVPPNWTVWFCHDPNTWDQPEGRDSWIQNDPNRVHSGNKSYMYFTFYRKHDAGLYQQVNVTKGQKLNLTAWAHSWSNTKLDGHEGCHNDPTCSCGVGNNICTLYESEVPELNGNAWNDAIGNFAFQLGIDPKGGINPLSTDVVWGEKSFIYNGHCPVIPVEATALSSTVTVFLRSTTLWAFEHNDAYWDDVVLTASESEGCRGGPRIQYERTYVLLPPSADKEWGHAVIDGSWDEHRYTVGGSADDAGIGDLDDRNIIAVNPEEWPSNLEEFYGEYYPEVNYSELKATSPEDLTRQLRGEDNILLCQRDPRWENLPFGSGSCHLTMGQSGCYITTLAMAQRFYGVDPDATPVTVNEALGPDGYTGCRALWSAMPDALGLRITSTTGADAALLGGYAVLAEIAPTSYEHFVFVTRKEAGRYWMYDPWKCVSGWLDDYYPGVDSWRIIKPYDPTPPPPPPVPVKSNYLGLHLQTMANGWDEYYSQTDVPICKVLASMQDVIGAKRVSPEAAVIWRHVTNNYGDTLENPNPMDGARIWVDKFRDSLYEVCNNLAQMNLTPPYFYVESLNEVYPSLNEPIVQRAINFDIAFIEALAETELPIKPAVFCAAVGNPHETEYNLLIPLGKKCQAAGGAFGYHPYYWANQNESGLESWWKYHAGRWTEIDKVLVQNGVHVKWYGGESGVVGSSNGHALLPNDGWKADTCYNGNWGRYLNDLKLFNEKIRDWNSTHDGRFLGSVLFTSGAGFTGWDSFQIRKDEMQSLKEI